MIREVDIELSNLHLNDNEQCVAYYSELPWFPKGQFSISLIRSFSEDKYKLLVKEWDYKYDCNRFSTGVFNLDRLCIHEKELYLSEEQKEQIEKTLDLPDIPDTIDAQGYIILDGTDYTLNINTGKLNKKYIWKIPSENIRIFVPLINLIKCLSEI